MILKRPRNNDKKKKESIEHRVYECHPAKPDTAFSEEE